MGRQFAGGSSDRIDVGTFSVVTPGITISCWFYLTAFSDTVDYRFISKASGVSAAQHDWMFGVGATAGPNGRLRCRSNNNAATLLSPTNLTANVWTHGAMTSQTDAGAGTNLDRYLYLNGVQTATDSQAGGGGATHPSNSDGVLIGNQPTATSSAPAGMLAEMGMWNVILTVPEIQLLASGVRPIDIRTSNLVAYWPLNGNVSPEPDMAGSYAGTVTGAVKGDHPKVNPNKTHNNIRNIRVGTGMGRSEYAS